MKVFIKNWSYLVVSDIITKFIGFFATILLARSLTPSGYGDYNVILAVSAIFVVLANFGMTQIITREVARKEEISGILFFRVLLIRFFASILAVSGITVYFLIFEPEVHDLIIVFTCVLTISLTAWDMAESFAFGKQVMKYSAIINIIASFAWIISLFSIPADYFTILNVLIIFSIIDVLKAAVYFIILKKKNFLKKITHVDVPGYKNIVIMSLPYLWLWGIGIFTNQIPVLFLSKNSGSEEVGYFSVGLRLILPLILVTSTAMKAVFPNLSKLFKDDPDRFRKVISDGIVLIVFLGSIAAAMLTIFSSYFIPVLFGEAYLNSVMPFNFLVWFIIIYSIDVLLGTSLSASDKQNTLAALATVDFIIALPILYYGSLNGAYYLALAKLVIGIILLSYHWIFIKKIIGSYFSISSWLFVLSFCFVLATATILPGISLEYKIAFILCVLLVYILMPNSKFRLVPVMLKKQFIK